MPDITPEQTAAKTSPKSKRSAAVSSPPSPVAILDYGTGKVLELEAGDAQARIDAETARPATPQDRALNKA